MDEMFRQKPMQSLLTFFGRPKLKDKFGKTKAYKTKQSCHVMSFCGMLTLKCQNFNVLGHMYRDSNLGSSML